MIRVRKSITAPLSLSSTQAYDGEDVKKHLLDDQSNKCYLCERKLETDFQIEHYKSQENYPEHVQDWENLFLGCSYCNGKKLAQFDNILNPVSINVEEEIRQIIDFESKKAVFTSKNKDCAHAETIELLSRIHNGTKRVRNIKEEKFIVHVISVLNRFLGLVDKYLNHASVENEKQVRNELQTDKEMLGFKYWIIKDNPLLFSVFENDIKWNKQ